MRDFKDMFAATCFIIVFAFIMMVGMSMRRRIKIVPPEPRTAYSQEYSESSEN
jgi:hypothetical protein